MNYTLFLLLGSSIFIAVITGWIRYRMIHPAFHPFLFFLTIGACNDTLSYFLSAAKLSTHINNNIYVLIEAWLLLWQLKNWGGFLAKPWLFKILLLIITLTWCIETALTSLSEISSYYRLLYSITIILISISVNNSIIVSSKKPLLKNATFLICAGFIIYYTYKVLVETFWLYGLNASRSFRINVYAILAIINLFVNLIYTTAILWIPSKQRFTVPSS